MRIYRDIGTATADRAPDIVIEHAFLYGAHKSELVRDGRTLLVLTTDGVVVFSEPLTAPTYEKRLEVSSPVDVYYLP